MIELIIGGIFALTSGVVVGILTPSINAHFKRRKLIHQQLLKLISTLYHLKISLNNYLHLKIYVESVDGVEREEHDRLKYFLQQLNINTNSLYQIQQELITYIKTDIYSVSEIYTQLDSIDTFVFSTRMYYNNMRYFDDQETYNDYSNSLSKMLKTEMEPLLIELIALNYRFLKINSKNTKR